MVDITEEDAHLLFKILAKKLGAVDIKLQQFGNVDGKPFYEAELITADRSHSMLQRYISPLKNYYGIFPTFIGGFSWKDIFERILSSDVKKVGFSTINGSMFISFPSSIEEIHLMLDLEN